jgi:NitT/TauT family transport system substrate-binding protein
MIVPGAFTSPSPFFRRIGVLFVVVLAVASCGLRSSGDDARRAANRGGADATGESGRALRIAEQHGLAYAPLAVLQITQGLESAVDGPVEWVRMNNAAGIREAMLAGRLDVGFMGVPPYLIGKDRGMEWQVFVGLSEAPLGLVSLHPDVVTLSDLVRRADAGRVALPQPGSIQHILLAMALERAGFAPDALDSRLISMAHPDGMAALLARGDVVAHFTSPPFLGRELQEPGARLLVDGTEAFGEPFTFIVGVTTAMGERSPVPVTVVRDAVADAVTRVSRLQAQLADDAPLPSQAVALLEDLAEFYGLDPDDLSAQLVGSGIRYSTEVRGVERFHRTMTRQGYLRDEAP